MNTPDTDRLAKIRARLDAATPGPWEAQDYDSHPGEEGCAILAGVGLRSHAIAASITYPWHDEANTVADAELIANAPADLAHLLSLVEQLQGQRDKAREVHYPVNIFAESDEPPYMCGWRAVCNHSENAWPCSTAKALGLGEGADDA